MQKIHSPIGIIRGEGIGPEIMREALRCLDVIQKCFNTDFRFIEYHGNAPATSFSEHAYAQLSTFYEDVRAQNGCVLRAAIYARTVFQLRKEFLLTIKPILFNQIPELETDCFLSPRQKLNYDVLLIRQNTYDFLWDEEVVNGEYDHRIFAGRLLYDEDVITDLAQFAFEKASIRKGRLFLFLKVDVEGKLNQLWLEVFNVVGQSYPQVTWDWDHPDGGFAALLKNPNLFDVIVAQNKEGDLISDPLGTVLYGSYAVVPSANINPRNSFMTFQTVHGTAHELAGQNKANPIGMIRSAAIMLRLFFKMEEEAEVIELAIRNVLGQRYRTIDMYRPELGHKLAGTKEMGDRIVDALRIL